jgi:hypothetical protein
MKDSHLVTTLIAALEDTEIGAKGRYRESLREQFARAGAERILSESCAR